jgi:hypothetical protein
MLRQVPVYRLHDTVGDFRGLLEHPAADVEPGAVVHLSGGREAIVTARAETNSDRVRAQALLEVLVAPTMPPIPHLTP